MSVGFTVDRPKATGTRANVSLAQRKYVGVPATPDLRRKNILSRTAYCKIKVFHYLLQNFTLSSKLRAPIDPTQFLQVSTFEATDAVANLTVSKSLTETSGTFEVALYPTQNWKASISPGDWVAIYLYGETESQQAASSATDSKNLLVLGNVDRIARALLKDPETDKTTLRYQVSGRNFGKVFETTDIFYNPYQAQERQLDVALQTAGLPITGAPHKMVGTLLDIFLGTGATVETGLINSLNQWMLPQPLANLFAAVKQPSPLKVPTLNDILLRLIDEVPGYKADQMLTVDDNGSLFEVIRRASNLAVNEVFVEETRLADCSAVPTLVLRPRPVQSPFFANNAGNYLVTINDVLGGAYKSLQQLATESFIELSPVEILHEDVGKDDHSRMNMLWFLTPSSAQFTHAAASSITPDSGIGNPVTVNESINRHGLRKFEHLIEFCQPATGPADLPVIDLLQAFIAQLYDQNYANHLYESGTIECTGVLEAELGKALIVLSNRPGNEQKRLFYVEGYEHRWTWPSHWTTTFMVTHGQFLDPNHPFIDVAASDQGAPDLELDQGYLAQTFVKRK